VTAPLPFCEDERRDDDGGLHPCGRTAGHDGAHVCALVGICGERWLTITGFVRSEHLGPCARCGEVVRPLDECSTCLEEDGVVRHAECCDD
jgi:hypothetical protein